MGRPERVRLRDEAESTRCDIDGKPEGWFLGRKHHKPRLSLNNNTAGVRERERENGAAGPSDIEGKTKRVGASECGQRMSFNRTRVAGSRHEVEGVVASTRNLYRSGASLLANSFGVGFIDWLDVLWRQ
jgi:hypothetical protein